MSHIGRRLFAALTRDMDDDQRRLAREDLWRIALMVCIILAAWLTGLYIIEHQHNAMLEARQDAAMEVFAEAKVRAHRDAEAYWATRTAEAYRAGVADECHRQRTARHALALPCGVDQ